MKKKKNFFGLLILINFIDRLTFWAFVFLSYRLTGAGGEYCQIRVVMR